MPYSQKLKTLAGSTAAVQLLVNKTNSKYFSIQNTHASEDLWWGFNQATTIATESFILPFGETKELSLSNDSSGAMEIWAMAPAATDVTCIVATNGDLSF